MPPSSPAMKNAGHIGLEVAAHVGDVDAARLGAEDQRQGLHRAGAGAGAMADAGGGVDERGLAADDAQGALRAGLGTSAGSSRQRFGSTTGCRDGGSIRPAFFACARASISASCRRLRLTTCQATAAVPNSR